MHPLRSTRAALLVAAAVACAGLACGPQPTQPSNQQNGTNNPPTHTPDPNNTDPDPNEPDPDPNNPDPDPDPNTNNNPNGAVPDIKLLVDANRDGVANEADAALDRKAWNAQLGAVFLANIDDDTKRCPGTNSTTDAQLAACHDASDEIVNGNDDLLDLAPVKVRAWAQAVPGTTAKLEVAPAAAAARVRFFKKVGTSYAVYAPGAALTEAELKSGLDLLIEGKDIVRDASVWNGYVDLTLTVTVPNNSANVKAGTYTDQARMRVSPVMTFHHLLPSEQLFVSAVSGNPDSTAFRSAVKAAASSLGSSAPWDDIPVDIDQWTQDFFETGYMSMPGPSGAQKVIRVNYRSANYYNPQSASFPLRQAGRVVFTRLRGKDVAGVQEFDKSHSQQMQSLNSFGNLETIPPYTHNGQSYPLGRVLRGSVSSFYTDKRFTRMVEAQAMQPAVYVDTSWLIVSHVDETISFVKANSPRGWVMLVGDPTLARNMLQQAQSAGNGNVTLHTGKYVFDLNGTRLVSATRTISQVLADTAIMQASATAAAAINAQVAIIKQATGLTEGEIVRIPFLFESDQGYLIAYQPGTVNALVVDGQKLIAPDPFGPIIGGKDIFKTQFENALAPYGVGVRWVDDWDLYHRLSGEVHCGTNSARQIPTARWWESGR